MELNIQQIMEILPHRPPFLLVDRITDCEPGVKATGVKCVTMNEPFFVGHFPGNPIMPGVLILEALAQTGAVAALSLPENRGKLAIFGGVKNARFKQPVRPGDVLVVLEAMKMEIEVSAPVDGTVKAVSAVVGTAVNTDDLLVTIG